MTLIANVTADVNPSDESVEALAAIPDNDALAMLNVLDFSTTGGREAYARYTAVAGGTVAKRGGSVLVSGTVLPSGGLGWDSLVVVRYPRRAAYLDMQSDPAYVGAIPDRTAGLARRLLYPFALADDAEPKAQVAGSEIVAMQLVRFASDQRPSQGGATSTSGELLYSLPAGGPAMVADGLWHLMQLWRYSSVSAAEEDEPARQIAGSEHEITLLIEPDQMVIPTDLA